MGIRITRSLLILNVKKYGYGMLTSIYSWCGFYNLKIIIEIPKEIDREFNFIEKNIITLTYKDTNPGWIDIKDHHNLESNDILVENKKVDCIPLFSNPWWVVKIKYTPKIRHAYQDGEYIVLKQIFLYMNDYNKYCSLPQMQQPVIITKT